MQCSTGSYSSSTGDRYKVEEIATKISPFFFCDPLLFLQAHPPVLDAMLVHTMTLQVINFTRIKENFHTYVLAKDFGLVVLIRFRYVNTDFLSNACFLPFLNNFEGLYLFFLLIRSRNVGCLHTLPFWDILHCCRGCSSLYNLCCCTFRLCLTVLRNRNKQLL